MEKATVTKKVIHTCYGCKEYYRINELTGFKEWAKPHSYVNCGIDDVWKCDYFANNGKPYWEQSKSKTNK